jgi:nucleoside-diphosphate-sugar epimerase
MSYLKMFNAALNGKTYFQNGTGEALRDFTYISDAIEAIIRLEKLEKFSEPVVNIGGGHNRSMIEVRNIIESLTDKYIHIETNNQNSAELAETLASPEMLQKLTNFSPAISIESGLSDIHKWITEFNLRSKIQVWTKS